MLTFGLNLDLVLRIPTENPLDIARRIVTDWCDEKLAAIPELRRALFSRREHEYAFEGTRLWEFTLEQPSDDHDGTWATEVLLMHVPSATDIQAAVTMKTSPKTPALAPFQYFVETPRFVRHLERKFQLSVAGNRPSSGALVVHKEADAKELADFLLHPDRSLPVVLATAPTDAAKDDGASDLAKHLADYLFPMAHVFGAGREATYVITDRVGKTLSVFDGGVRIYWPGFAVSDNPRRHKLFWKEDVLASLQFAPDDPYKLLRFNAMTRLTRAAAARFEYPKRMLNALNEAKAAELATTITSLDLEQATHRISELAQERDYYKELGEDLERRLREAMSRLEELESDDAQEKVDASWEIADIEEAIARAQADFSETLLFPKEFSRKTNMQAGYWYNVLKSLHELCLKERKGLGRRRGNELREILTKYVRTPGSWRHADTGVYVTNPETGEKVQAKDRVHLKDGAPQDTESAYWEALGEQASRRYLIARLGTHA